MSTTSKRYGIVVGIDGSTASKAAVCWAAQEAARKNVPLTLVHTFNTFVPTHPQVPLEGGVAVWQEDDGRNLLELAGKVATEAVAGQTIAINTEVKKAPAVPTLVEMSGDAEMVVVGRSGRGLMSRALLGSVSSNVVRGARCPVAVIHEEASELAHPDQAPVLVGIDCSPASDLAVAVAFDEASCRGVDLVALHAWADVPVLAQSLPDWEPEAERSLAEYLAGWQERYPGVTVRRIATFDNPGRELIEASKLVQLVVVGSHGRGGLTGMLLGSVSNALVQSSHAPVIVARPS